MIVLDASAVVELLLNLPLGPQVRSRLEDPNVQLHAPELLTIEVLQVLRRRVASGASTVHQAQTAIELLAELDVNYHDHRLLAQRIWQLRDNLTAYDAAYFALGELLDAPVVTTDARLAHAPGRQATVQLVSAAP